LPVLKAIIEIYPNKRVIFGKYVSNAREAVGRMLCYGLDNFWKGASGRRIVGFGRAAIGLEGNFLVAVTYSLISSGECGVYILKIIIHLI